VCASTTPIAWPSSRGSHCLHHPNCTTLIVVAIAAAVLATAVISSTLVELAPYGPLGILLVGDVNVEPSRVFKELQA